jgi:hypothetical protein
MDTSLYPFRVLYSIPPMNLTVLRVPVSDLPYHYLDLDFAIDWDEDRDQRIFPAARQLWYQGLLPAFVLFVGERKGILTITVDPGHPAMCGLDDKGIPGGSLQAYRDKLNKLAAKWVDDWEVEIVSPTEHKLRLARSLKLGAWIRDDDIAVDYQMRVPATGWLP